MKITKQNLYDFVAAKVKAQQDTVRQQIDSIIDAKVDPILDSIISLSLLERDAERLAQRLDVSIQTYKAMDSWTYKNLLANINSYLTAANATVKKDLKRNIHSLVRDTGLTAVNLGDAELNAATLSLQKECIPLYKKISDLNALKTELDSVIAIESTGAKGYKALVALGVDMSGFEAATPQLPAIIKLSIDPAILSGIN